MLIEISERALSGKSFASSVNLHKRVTSAEVELNNKWTRWYILSPAILVLTQWAHKFSMVGGMKVMHKPNKCTSCYQGQMATSTTGYPICQQQRPTLSPQYGTILCGAQPTNYGRLVTLKHFPKWKGLGFVLIGIDICGYSFSFLNCSSKPLHRDLQLLSHCCAFPTMFLLAKRLILKQIKCYNGLMIMQFTSLNMFLITWRYLVWEICEVAF